MRAVSTRMERERPNARPALLDIPATGGAWAILGIRTLHCMRAGSVRAVRTRMERERPNVRPARLGFPVVKMGPSQAQGTCLQLLDGDGTAPAATGKKDCNHEL